MSDDKTAIKVKFWGVRGSIPSPLTQEQLREKEAFLLQHLIEEIKAKGSIKKIFGRKPGIQKYLDYLANLELTLSGTYGGNTTCIEVQVEDSPLCIVDAGSGMKNLGADLLQERFFKKKSLNPLNTRKELDGEIHLFLSHYHWDHIQGFPFFGPAFMTGVKFCFYGRENSTSQLDELLRGQQTSNYFPVTWHELPCKKEFQELSRIALSSSRLGKCTVSHCETDHPGGSLGYAFENERTKVVILTDTEHRDIPPPSASKLAQNANMVYWDSQYLPEEYVGATGMPKYGWGHSTYEHGIRCALDAKAKCLLLGHHEPVRDDFGIKKMEERALEYRDQLLKLERYQGQHLHLFCAQEGMALELGKKGRMILHRPCGASEILQS